MQPPGTRNNEAYDFFMKEPPKPSKKLPLNLSGPILVLVIIIMLILIIIILSSVFLKGGKSSATDLVSIIGKTQEINRINTLEQPQIQDVNTADILVTTQTVLTSEQNQFNNYATKQKIKVDPKKLADFTNHQTDQQLQSAAQNNNLDGAYATYLKQALSDYSNSLAQAYQSTKSNELKSLLKSAYAGVQTLLSSSTLK